MIRRSIVGLAVIATLAVACRARADESAPPIASVLAARHLGRFENGALRWRSSFAFDDPRSRQVRVVFAAPLPPRAVVEAGARAVESGGRIVAVDLASDGPGASVVIPDVDPASLARLAPPLAEGSAVQSIALEGPDDPRFEPSGARAIERRVGHFAAIDVDEAAIERAVAKLGELPHAASPPIYLRASTRGGDPIDGKLTTASQRSLPVMALLGVACAVGCVLLALLHRLLGRAAKIEVADAALNERFERLGR